MSLHAAAMALLVPVRSLGAGIVQVPGQATVVAVLVGTLIGRVSLGAAKEAGQHLLNKHTHNTAGGFT